MKVAATCDNVANAESIYQRPAFTSIESGEASHSCGEETNLARDGEGWAKLPAVPGSARYIEEDRSR